MPLGKWWIISDEIATGLGRVAHQLTLLGNNAIGRPCSETTGGEEIIEVA